MSFPKKIKELIFARTIKLTSLPPSSQMLPPQIATEKMAQARAITLFHHYYKSEEDPHKSLENLKKRTKSIFRVNGTS